MKRIGFLINPVAGMGGAVGLKGTDGNVAEARRRGAYPTQKTELAELLNYSHRIIIWNLLPVPVPWEKKPSMRPE